MLLAAALCTAASCSARQASRADEAMREQAVVRPAAVAEPLSPASFLRQEWAYGGNPGSLISTPHYLIHTTVTSDRVRDRLPVLLEHAMHRYRTIFGNLPAPRDQLVTYVFQDRRQWSAKTREVLPDEAGDLENLGRGGFSTRGMAILYYIDWRGYDRDTFAIASHEGWHQFTQSTFRNQLPVWLEEGIATLMEGHSFRTDQPAPTFDPARNSERRYAMRRIVRRDRWIPLDRLLRERPQDFLGESKDALLDYYGHVWALSLFLLQGEDGKYKPALESLVQDAAAGRLYRRLLSHPAVQEARARDEILSGRSGPWIARVYFGVAPEELEESFRAFARGLTS